MRSKRKPSPSGLTNIWLRWVVNCETQTEGKWEKIEKLYARLRVSITLWWCVCAYVWLHDKRSHYSRFQTTLLISRIRETVYWNNFCSSFTTFTGQKWKDRWLIRRPSQWKQPDIFAGSTFGGASGELLASQFIFDYKSLHLHIPMCGVKQLTVKRKKKEWEEKNVHVNKASSFSHSQEWLGVQDSKKNER